MKFLNVQNLMSNQKWGKSLKKHNLLEEYSARIYEIDPYFYNKLIKMGVNIYSLEFIFILVSVF